MPQSQLQAHVQLLFTLLLAVLLEIYPLPEATSLWRPQWMLLAVFIWIQRRPLLYGMGTAFCAGLLLDLVMGVSPGRYALALTVCAYLAILVQTWLRHLAGWHQVLLVMLLAWLCGALVLCVDWLLLGDDAVSRSLGWSALASGLVWVFVRALARFRFTRH